MKKIINSADKQYVPVDTENLVLDDTPTEGSFNAVTSDGVAKAIAGGGGGTEYTAGDGIDITEDTISAKIDNDTIVLNGSGELMANVSGGTSYSNGSAINIDANNQINVSAAYGTEFGLDPAIYTSSTLGSDTEYREFVMMSNLPDSSPSNKLSVKFNQNKDQITLTGTSSQLGCAVRVVFGSTDDFGTNGFYISSSDLIDEDTGDTFYLDGSSTTTILNGSLITGYSLDYVSNVLSPLEDWVDWNPVNRVWLVAYNNGAIVGDPIGIGTSAQFVMDNNFNPSTLRILHPLPSALGTAGQVLTVNSGATGVEWATPSGGSGGRTSVVRNVSSLTRSGTTWTGTFFYDFDYLNLPDMVAIHMADSCVGASGADTQKFKLGLNFTDGSGDHVYWLQPAFVESTSNGWCPMHGTVSTVNFTPIINDGAAGFTGFTMVAPFTPSADYVSDVKVEFFFPAN